MNWARFERFALDGPESEWLTILFWPQCFAQIVYLILYPLMSRRERGQ